MEIDKEEIKREYARNLVKIEYTLFDIMDIVKNNSPPNSLEGNCFYYHLTDIRYNELINKQYNLFWCGQQISKRICEIGFNAGHSAYLLLLGLKNTTPVEFTIFDICEHSYVKPCSEYIKNNFNNVRIELIEGNSIITMPEWIDKNKDKCETYDVVHVDGGHSEECIENDLKNATKLVKPGGIIIIDDTQSIIINMKVNKLLEGKMYEEISIFPTVGYEHRIIRRKN